MRLRSAGLRMGTFSSPHSLVPMLGQRFSLALFHALAGVHQHGVKGCHGIAPPLKLPLAFPQDAEPLGDPRRGRQMPRMSRQHQPRP